jgi:Zn-dependent protease
MPEEHGGWEAPHEPTRPTDFRPGGAPEDYGIPLPPQPPAPSFDQPASQPPPSFRGPGIQRGSLRLFRVVGIDVFVHWSWLVVAVLQYEYHANRKDMRSPVWFVVEYLTVFGIVLLHEFGHALACRSVGGKADRIYLWPLGGVAFVQPPPRPGPYLWSLAAGPLVNLVLVPITLLAVVMASVAHWQATAPDLNHYLVMVFAINLFLFLFNMLPIFPLDGGQIVHALLWMVIGRARSLMVVTTLSLVLAAGALVVCVATGLWWPALIAGFAVLACLGGIARAQVLLRILNAPRHEGFVCPGCGESPPAGEFWMCGRCMLRYDTFAHETVCPRCGTRPQKTACPSCNQSYPFADWCAPVLPADEGAADPTQHWGA